MEEAAFDPQLHTATGITQDIRGMYSFLAGELSLCENLGIFRSMRKFSHEDFYHVDSMRAYMRKSPHHKSLMKYMPSKNIQEKIDAQVLVLNIFLDMLRMHAEDEDISDVIGNDFYILLKQRILEVIGRIEDIINTANISHLSWRKTAQVVALMG